MKMEIRPLKEEERPLLREFLYQSIFQKNPTNPIPPLVIEEPNVAIYIENFGQREDDHCLVAQVNGRVVGAVWVRLLNQEPRGYGNVDEETPEFAIALLPLYRGQGIGQALMENMIGLLKKQAYPKASLSVQKQNPACRLYERLGFIKAKENEEDWIMVKYL